MRPKEEMEGFARDALGLSRSTLLLLTPLPGRGSDRVFFRVTRDGDGNDSYILIDYDPKRTENAYYAGIATFLGGIGVSVPRLVRHDQGRCLILMEDLGDRDLWSFRKTSWENFRLLYEKTVVIVHRLHSFPLKDFSWDSVRLMKGFGPELYRWERDYFKAHFVRGFCGIGLEASYERELEAELSALAERVARSGLSLVHRDLQSQNVMIRHSEPFLIDFQGMRAGSPFYDLGSLLNDPYVGLSEGQVDQLLTFYYGLTPRVLDPAVFPKYFWEASAQRLMQALGAYGYLGLNRGIKAFLKHIPSGLRNLCRAAEHSGRLPRLLELCRKCEGLIGQDKSQPGQHHVVDQD